VLDSTFQPQAADEYILWGQESTRYCI